MLRFQSWHKGLLSKRYLFALSVFYSNIHKSQVLFLRYLGQDPCLDPGQIILVEGWWVKDKNTAFYLCPKFIFQSSLSSECNEIRSLSSVPSGISSHYKIITHHLTMLCTVSIEKNLFCVSGGGGPHRKDQVCVRWGGAARSAAGWLIMSTLMFSVFSPLTLIKTNICQNTKREKSQIVVF